LTDGEARPPTASGRSRWSILFGHLDRLLEHRGLKTFVAIAEVAATVSLIVGGVTAVVHFFGGGDDEPVAAPSGASTGAGTGSTTQPSPTSSAPTGPTSPAGVKCWTSAKAVVDCQETHRYEEIPQVPSCDQGVVTGFLGGLATVDVLVAHPASMPGSSCVLDAGHELRGSAKDALQSGTAAVWRRCSDRAVGKNVPCSTVHTGEYVATGKSSRATDPDCLVAAAAYLDQLPGNLVEDLTVRAINVKSGLPDPARCIIEARGNHRLTDSVRSLGSRPVPVLTN
jgi:hypothetical protein